MTILPTKIYLFIFFAAIQISAQFESTPYRFEKTLFIEGHRVYEGSVIEKDKPNLITTIDLGQNKKNELRVSDENYLFIDNLLLDSDSCSFSEYLSVFDFDKDGLDEIIIPVIFENKTKFYLYNHKDTLHKKQFFQIEGTNPDVYEGIYYTYKNLDDDENYEVIIGYCENFPKIGSIRGFFAVDIETSSLLWYYPTAYYFYNVPQIEYPDTSKAALFISTSGVSNGLSFSNDTFYLENEAGEKLSYKTPSRQGPTFKTTADTSNDNEAVMLALDNYGNKLWEKKLGGEFVWTDIAEVTNNSFLVGEYHRGKTDNSTGRLLLVDIEDGKIVKEYMLKEKARNMENLNNQFAINYYDNSSDILDAELNIINQARIKNLFLYDSYMGNGQIYYFGFREVELERYSVILDSEFNEFAAIKSEERLSYFPKLNRFYINSENGAHLFQLVYVPWYKRISSNTFYIILLSTAALILVLLSLWALTMHFASKRIRLQKAELERTTAELVETEKLAIMGVMASSLAHEINSPLGAIKNSAQRLLNDKLEEPERKRNLELISRAVNNSSVLIQKFLNRSRNDTEENYAYFDDALTEWKSLFHKQYELMRIEIIEKLDQTKPVNLSQSELMQILNNVLSNAKDALNENEVSNRKIILSTIQKDVYVEISVEDNGKGFDEEIRKNAFEPFKTTKKQGEGTGLGLWIVKQILDQKGGSIEISNLKKGSIVKINLPIYYDKNGKELQSANS